MPTTGAKSDAERALVRMAIGALVFVVLAIDALVLAMPRGDGMTGLRPESEYNLVATPVLPGPNYRVALIGDDGARVEVGIRPAGEMSTPGVYLGQQNLLFTVHLHNTGKVWVGTRLDLDAWVLDASGADYAANQQLSLQGGPYGSTDLQENPAWRLPPGAEVDRNLVFTVPQGDRLTRLHLEVATRTAEWNL